MKLKYYLRGLGIGIAVTALIMGITVKKTGLTDAQIKERALALGMVEKTNTVLAEEESLNHDVADSNRLEEEENTEKENTEEENTEEENTVSDQTVSTDKISENQAPDLKVGTKADEAEDGQAIKKQPEDVKSESVVVTVASGQSSISVAKSCEALGLVKNAAEFDRLLCSKGYDRKIVVGNHTIPAGTSEEEVGRLLTVKN